MLEPKKKGRVMNIDNVSTFFEQDQVVLLFDRSTNIPRSLTKRELSRVSARRIGIILHKHTFAPKGCAPRTLYAVGDCWSLEHDEYANKPVNCDENPHAIGAWLRGKCMVNGLVGANSLGLIKRGPGARFLSAVPSN